MQQLGALPERAEMVGLDFHTVGFPFKGARPLDESC